jgi:hypothetical protein
MLKSGEASFINLVDIFYGWLENLWSRLCLSLFACPMKQTQKWLKFIWQIFCYKCNSSVTLSIFIYTSITCSHVYIGCSEVDCISKNSFLQ